MRAASRSLLVIQVAGLGYASIGERTPHLARLASAGTGPIATQPPLPALTSPSQATLLTGLLPQDHGIIANGWYFREMGQILNWQRSAKLMQARPLWEEAARRRPGLKSANLFWRYAAHGSCDTKVIERPTYWADGSKSEDIYTEPPAIKEELISHLGPFPLFRFWGPVADISSSRWIADATLHLLRKNEYHLILSYLPHLDYEHQRYGPEGPAAMSALEEVDREIGRLIDEANRYQYDVAVVSDYAFEPVDQSVFPNQILREAGWLQVESANNGELLEPGASRAFAVCDQQIALVYVNDPKDIPSVQQLLAAAEGIEHVWGAAELAAHGMTHARTSELVAIAAPRYWFAYPYWHDASAAPDFARCVAIHAKPGFDPVELYLASGWQGKLHLAKRMLQKKLGLRAPFDVIDTDTSRIGGSHGRIPQDNSTRPCFVASWPCPAPDLLPMQDVASYLLGRLAE